MIPLPGCGGTPSIVVLAVMKTVMNVHRLTACSSSLFRNAGTACDAVNAPWKSWTGRAEIRWPENQQPHNIQIYMENRMTGWSKK
jgi:hypothetical protein